MPTVTMSLDPRDKNNVWIASPYEAKDIIKAFPQRRWNPIQKVWIIPVHHESMAKATLIDAGFRVRGLTQVERDLMLAERRIASLERELRSSKRGQPVVHHSGDPFSDLDRMVPENLRGSLYKALIRVFHPDMGGSTELAQMLNKSSLAKNRVKS